MILISLLAVNVSKWKKTMFSCVYYFVVEYVDLGTGESRGLVFGAQDTYYMGNSPEFRVLKAPRFQFFHINYNFVPL